ncbi:cysteine proteinase [Hypoxylon trugodes]|uniref:cysteine proteinase n=1 Tax=Hypoxylon trugodes TaxID=326681 RepID=UPI0021900A3D|nr:cysteine proteinase [Hypoxylon trugodes]KAI1394333.1 cysteine proteinase [Hypoxylon trugodes]
MVSSSSQSDSSRGASAGNIDAYALFEALTGHKIDRRSIPSSRTMSEDYEVLGDDRPLLGQEPSPDEPPKDVNIGAINPYALVEAMIGHRLDRHALSTARIISDVLQTDYEELFDLKHNSVLFAGLKLNEENRQAEELSEKEMQILEERDLVTPDLSRIKKLDDLEKIGLKEVGDTRIKMARMQNGKLRLVLDGQSLGRTVGNHDITETINDLVLPFRHGKEDREWTPPNSSWRDMNEAFFRSIPRRFMMDGPPFSFGGSHHSFREQYQHRFDDPTQGAASNSWLIAAIFSVFWANPAMINRSTRLVSGPMDRNRRTLAVKFHDKGGRNNAETDTVEVDYQIPVNNSTDLPIYARSSDGYETWPSLYEKAFVKWMSHGKDNNGGNNRNTVDDSSDHIDLTKAHNGDPIKAMAQINGREPRYYFTDRHSGAELAGLVRACSVNKRTISPMAAWTHATGDMFRGSNLVANHAYSILGWVSEGQEENQYIIVRNPWGVTEPRGLTSYPGLLDRVEPEFWPPAALLDRDGVFSVEVQAFKKYFACIGVAK